MLYNAGFESIYIPGNDGITALSSWAMKLLTNSVIWRDQLHFQANLDAGLWYLSRGANPVFYTKSESESRNWPTVLFYLAGILPGLVSRNAAWIISYHVDGRIRSIFNSLYAHTDGCECFCSDQGCLPSAMFWYCSYPAVEHILPSHLCQTRHHNLINILELFSELCDLSETQLSTLYAAICRSELFQRLGLTHTCCHCDLPGIRPALAGEERRRIQEEESELKSQLELLIAEYHSAWSRYDGPIMSFWAHWWHVVGKILPPLTAQEACKVHLRGGVVLNLDELRGVKDLVFKERARRECESLVQSGYDPEMDFADIIKDHFARNWDLFSSTSDTVSGSESWTDDGLWERT